MEATCLKLSGLCVVACQLSPLGTRGSYRCRMIHRVHQIGGTRTSTSTWEGPRGPP